MVSIEDPTSGGRGVLGWRVSCHTRVFASISSPGHHVGVISKQAKGKLAVVAQPTIEPSGEIVEAPSYRRLSQIGRIRHVVADTAMIERLMRRSTSCASLSRKPPT